MGMTNDIRDAATSLPWLAFLLLASFAPLSSHAADLSSTSFIARAGHFVASAGTAQVAQNGDFSSSGSAGQSEALGLGGNASDLTTSAPGFWPVVAGDLPGIDTDLDGISVLYDNCAMVANFDQLDFDGDLAGDACDADDDDDGLDDVVESNTGLFVSAFDTGSNPLDADSDDDGFNDGDEVAAGSDPNDPQSTPLAPAVPTLSPLLQRIALPLLVMTATSAVLRRRSKETSR
jgi:hypothetical protein